MYTQYQEINSHVDLDRDIYSKIFTEEKGLENKQHVEFIEKLSKILPNVGNDEDRVIHLEVLVALSVEGILTKENMAEKTPMIQAICEMIKFDEEKKASAIEVAKRLLK